MPGLGGRSSTIICAVLLATLVGCATPANQSGSGQPSSSGARVDTVGPKRIVIGIPGDLPVLNKKVIREVFAYTSPGGSEVEDLITDGLSDLDDDELPHAKLAEAIPTLENGLWKVLPDGTMETTWKIRENARWHDGTLVTTDDVLFTMEVVRDRELPLFRDATYDFISHVQASDARTVKVTWSQAFIQADTLFSKDLAQPLPKHLLEAPYTSDKANFAQLPFWSAEFIGTGPYRLKSFNPGTGLVLAAFDDYVLGRPKIDEIEVRFILDPNTLVANLYSGAVDATMGRGLSLDQAVQAKEQWPAGRAITAPNAWVVIFPQFVNPTPSAIADVRFRRALMFALDRQQMVDTMEYAFTEVAHSFVSPKHPDFTSIQGDIVRYDFDPRQAARLIEEVGFSKAADGFYRDATGQRLGAEIWASNESKPMIATADFWRQAGVDAEPIILPPQRWNDREYVANFPGFRMNRQANTVANLRGFQSSQAPIPETRFIGVNYSRYMNPELDGLIDRYFTTIPKADRARLLGDAIHHMTDVLNIMGLFYDVQVTLAANRITGMTTPETGWNAQEWDTH